MTVYGGDRSVASAGGRLRPEETDATRYLCAAPYLDERFARQVLDEVLHDPHRAVAPSHGISLIPIIRHCLAARRRSLARDAIVAGVLVLGLLVAFGTGAVLLMGLLSLWLLGRGVRLLLMRQVTSAVPFLLAGLLLVPLIVYQLFGAVTALLTTLFFGGFYAGTEVAADAGGLVWLVILLVVWGTYFGHRLLVHHTIAVELTPDGYDPRRAPAAGPVHERRLAHLESAQVGNVTVYSEQQSARPFIGFGDVVTAFSLVTPLQPARTHATDASGGFRDAGPVAFSVEELYEGIRTGMVELADPRLPPDEAVPHLSVRDRVFVAGRLPVTSRYLDQGQPRSRLTEQELTELQHRERGRVRHYQSVRMAAWSGELEVTTFLHATLRGRMLFVEFVATMIPGIRAAYHRIDTYNRLDAGAALWAAAGAFLDLLRAPIAVARVAGAAWVGIRRATASGSNAARIDRQLTFDYGCRSSVRELAADFDRPLRFQLYDADERVTVVQRRLLQVLVQFLSERGYDVSDLAGQATTVINNSTQIRNSNTFTNSTLNSSPVAAGNFAQATSSGTSRASTPPPAAGRPAPGG